MATPNRSAQSTTQEFDRLTAADIMERAVQFGHRITKADVLASLMIEGFGSVPILNEDRRLAGIVTEFDLLDALDSGRRLSDLLAQDIMTKDAVSVSQDTDIRTVIYVLQTNHLVRVPVVDHERKLIGILARRDVLKGYLHSKAD